MAMLSKCNLVSAPSKVQIQTSKVSIKTLNWELQNILSKFSDCKKAVRCFLDQIHKQIQVLTFHRLA